MLPEAEQAAWAFMHLVVGGPSNASAWGVVLESDAIDRQTRYNVKLFLHGLLPQQNPDATAGEDNRRLKKLLAGTVEDLDLLRARLAQAATST